MSGQPLAVLPALSGAMACVATSCNSLTARGDAQVHNSKKLKNLWFTNNGSNIW